MRFSKEVIDQKLAQVPEDIRSVVLSDSASQTLIEMAKAYGLHIDQIGVLEEETLYVLLGLQTYEQFVKNLQGRMAVSQSTAVGLAQDVNKQIVSLIKSTVQDEGTNDLENKNSTANEIARADILSEIEDPTPIIQPISSANQGITNSDMQDDGSAQAQDFISGKLTGTVNLPSKKAVTTPESLSTKPPQKPAAKIDPYREPLA